MAGRSVPNMSARGLVCIEIRQRWTSIEVNSSEAGGLDPHVLFGEFKQHRKACLGETEMVDADCRQRCQRLKKIGKLGRIDIQFGVPGGQLMNAPRHPFQVMDFFRPAAPDVETNSANPCAVEFQQLLSEMVCGTCVTPTNDGPSTFKA